MKKYILFFLKLMVALGLLGFIFSRVDLPELYRLMLGVDVGYLTLTVALMFLSVYLTSWRLSLFAGGTASGLWPMMLKVYFFNHFLPAQLGGDLYKYSVLKNNANTGEEVAGAIVSDRLAGLTGLLILSLVCIITGSDYITDSRVYTGIYIYLVGMVLVLTLLFFSPHYPEEKIRFSFIKRIMGFIYLLRIRTRDLYIKRLAGGLGITLLNYLILIQLRTFSMSALHIHTDWVAAFIYIPLISVAILSMPFAINGLGIRENLSVFFFAMAGYSESEGLAMALVALFALLCVALAGAVLFAFSGEKMNLFQPINPKE